MEKVTERTGIYHEHQQGALCAQHALNNLLQNQVFLADSLADIARELDKEESSVLTHAAYESENMDDTGFFNIQVLQRALKMFEIELVPFGSQEPIAQQARSAPTSIQAYICNLGAHWFTVRRFARQYFNLNSMYYVPEPIPLQMLSSYLNIFKENGYSVFIVNGTLPSCLADQILDLNPINRQEYQLLTKDLPKLIMDDKVIGGPNGRLKNGNLVVQVPPDIYKEFQKNPNNPQLRQMILSQIPESFIEGDIPEGATGKNPDGPRRRRQNILIAPMSELGDDEQFIGVCGCPNCRQRSSSLSEQHEAQVFGGTYIDKPNEPQQKPQVITRQVTRVMISEPASDDSNPSTVQRRKVSRALVIVSQSATRLIDENDIPQMNRPNLENETDDDLLLKHVMAQSLLDGPEMNNDARLSLLRQQAEQSYQEMLDEFIATSIYVNELKERQIEQTRELLATVMMHSDSMAIGAPPSLPSLAPPSTTTTTTDMHSPPSTNIHSTSPSPNTSLSVPPNTPLSPLTNVTPPPLTNTSTAPSTNTSLPPPSSTTIDSSPPAMVNSPPSTTTNSTLASPPTMVNSPPLTTTNSTPASPTATADLSPSTSTNSDSVQSPTVEELRQRRLQTYGTRHKSIISVQSNFDD